MIHVATIAMDQDRIEGLNAVRELPITRYRALSALCLCFWEGGLEWMDLGRGPAFPKFVVIQPQQGGGTIMHSHVQWKSGMFQSGLSVSTEHDIG